MADETNDKTISSTNTGFPAYLDFDTLRSDAITYLGNLTGKIWTDYNVHDPGITILEALIYAILDLGYRTNLPAIDLFTKDPDDSSKENNFFTPAQILSNNPLTITDFRKMLIDISGVKNAWLEIEDKSPVDFCKNDNNIPGAVFNRQNDPCNCAFLNGLYHVFIELEKEYDITNNPEDADAYSDVLYQIKCALMRHRNLCEDFIDIKILCKLKTGLCADIELEPDAVAEDVYLEILEALREFFSPSPRFYTLPQLLEKGKSIEEIFSGRPYNVKESFGFVDTEEFEQITLRRKIYLSDVYHVLFTIEGVKNVRNLSWRICNYPDTPLPDTSAKWILHLPENYIPELDVGCSGFQFFRYGMRENVDTSNANSVFALNLSSNGKILYTQQNPYLDSAIPQGVYRKDLADYTSIQNDFPHVYGIKKGDLPDSASDERKAQVLQLQGFLLFFDQLLANYLGQLRNIRSLFSFDTGENIEEAHTYFTNNLTDVPQLDKLLRFYTGNGSGSLGSQGCKLAFPTKRKNLEELIASGKIINTDLDRRCNDPNKDDFPPYRFCYGAVRDQAENQLRDDLLHGDYEPVIISNYNNCYFFYLFTSSPDFALISSMYYTDAKQAQTAAASVKYLGTLYENYHSFIIEADSATQFFSFDLELNINTYSQYLQLIAEDQALYTLRRQGFLNHLLARFAEQFTDYALLSSSMMNGSQLQKDEIKAKEKFLTQYPDLSSNRGKAFNYKCNGWNNENISGFEKRVKALSGIQNWKKHYLCNFVVEKADEIYHVSISIFGNNFSVNEKLFTNESGRSSLLSVFGKLKTNADFETEYLPHEQKWSVFIKDDYSNRYTDNQLFDKEDDAQSYARTLHAVLADKPASDQNVFVSKYIFRIQFENAGKDLIEESKRKFDGEEDAQKYFNKIFARIGNYLSNPEEFVKHKKGLKLDKLILINKENDSALYIDKHNFLFRPIDVIQLNSEKKKFALLNDEKTIQFDSVGSFDTIKQAESEFELLLRLLADENNYHVREGEGNDSFNIVIVNSGEDKATYLQSFKTLGEAKNKSGEILKEIISHTFRLTVSEPLADNWEFKYLLKNPSGSNIEFLSQAGYTSESAAKAAAEYFYDNIPFLKIENSKKGIQIFHDKKKKIAAFAAVDTKTDASDVSRLLQYHQQLFSEINNPEEELIDKILTAGKETDRDEYIYKLVDKDNLLAKATVFSNDYFVALKYRNELINNVQSGYDYTQLSFGADIINERKDPATKITWYHYVIQSRNVLYQKGTVKGRPFILFESTRGYSTSDAAIGAFEENYLKILRKAFDADNYGEGKFISLNEILIHETDDCTKETSAVFVLPESLYEFDGDTANTIGRIIALAKGYPVLFIAEGRYRFHLYNQATESYDWRSMDMYVTPEDAMRNFRFFLTLLSYPGNIIVEKNESDCRFRIFIREVLAISVKTFPTAAAAWGNTGVEKFICISQTKEGFHTYLNRNNCSNSFYVACGNTGLVHPCKYEVPERREEALNKLFKAASFNFFDLLQQGDASAQTTLLNLAGRPLATLLIRESDNQQTDKCERLIEFFEAIYKDENFIESPKQEVYLMDDLGTRIAQPSEVNMKKEDWKKHLREVACYFPLYRKEKETLVALRRSGKCNFFVQIKLPGFNNCKEDLADQCPDISSDENCKPGCYIAWKSECCFSNCCDALEFYLYSLKVLNVFNNYKPVYECNCGYYGIELHENESRSQKRTENRIDTSSIERWLCGNNDDPANNNKRLLDQYFNKCGSEIIAINPQLYVSRDMACEAVNRAQKLINSDGLHVAEHILLRPRCESDCNCDYLPRRCFDYSNEQFNICHFEWKPGGVPDPCAADVPTCFTPGCDPYSFIATIALPAWPKRFRNKENREVAERLLQSEAPAHILLRILWLNPRDFCCFEYYFKKWNFWLAKKLCDIDYNNCDLLGLLFHKHFEPLALCNECEPCRCNQNPPVSCFKEDKKNDPCVDFNLLSQINHLYCWTGNTYDTYNCENEFLPPIVIPVLKNKNGVNELAVVSPTKKDSEKRKPIKTSSAAKPELPVDERRKYLLIQSRYTSYKQNIEKIVTAKPKSKVAGDALRFLSDANPERSRYEDLVNKILKNKQNKAKGIPGLSTKEKNILIDNISWQYFDRSIIEEKKPDNITKSTALYNHLRKNKIDMQYLYEQWNGKELQSIAPELDLAGIKKSVT